MCLSIRSVLLLVEFFRFMDAAVHCYFRALLLRIWRLSYPNCMNTMTHVISYVRYEGPC